MKLFSIPIPQKCLEYLFVGIFRRQIALAANEAKSVSAVVIHSSDCIVDMLCLKQDTCIVQVDFYQNNNLFRLEFYLEELFLEQSNESPCLGFLLKEPPRMQSEGDFLCSAGTAVFNFLMGDKIFGKHRFSLEKLNNFLATSYPCLSFLENDCIINLWTCYQQQKLTMSFLWSFLLRVLFWLLRFGLRVQVRPKIGYLQADFIFR